MSHRLPEPVLHDLQLFATGVEDRLQADAHKVAVATSEHPAFNVRWMETDLPRALIFSTACMLGASRFLVHDLGNGGVERGHIYGDVERRFRLRRAQRDAHGSLRVVSNSDSILTGAARETELTLFDTGDSSPPVTHEQWVLAYLLHPGTRTFTEVKAGRVVGLLTQSPPYRLRLADLVDIPFVTAPPPNFAGDEDDLSLDDEDEREDERGDEQAG